MGGRNEHCFSLIELLVVISIIGMLFAMIIPQFTGVEHLSKIKVNEANMRHIQEGFMRFISETGIANDPDRLKDIALYGLWPLTTLKHPNTALQKTMEYAPYNPDYEIGRRMESYLRATGVVKLQIPTVSGQNELAKEDDTKAITIPIMHDPFGGYYRILCPKFVGDASNPKTLLSLKQMVLISPGIDQTLDYTENDFENGELKLDPGQKDDFALKLFPLSHTNP